MSNNENNTGIDGYLRKIRKEKYPSLNEFATAFAKHTGQEDAKNTPSLISRWELRKGKPSKKNMQAIIELLELDAKKIGNLKRSFNRIGTDNSGHKKVKQKKNSVKKIAAKKPAQKQLLKKQGMITPADAQKFLKVVEAYGEMPLERAVTVLNDFAEKN